MSQCRACSAPVMESASFCSACGEPADPSGLETLATSSDGGARVSASPRTPLDGRFPPGHVLSKRYRVVALLGRGGMGEVYRADDLKLGLPVALKLLPADLEATPGMLARLLTEVRNARQVSHPHVCRVHDIGEADGRHFITMEYVDGEDLASLLRRIGRLPEAKAAEVGRQVALGLQAIHDAGVVHRDLKPGNVMIDGGGRARITDFGLAVSGARTAGEIAGTPAYMAPEQLKGGAATPQSDIYALGLLLYELHAGRRPFEARTRAEMERAHALEPPVPPSRHARDVSEPVEAVILRCLEKVPAARPRTAAQVALALSGADPLAVALAAGETPSPEVVAGASHGEGLRPRTVWMAFAAIAVLLAALSWAFRVNTYHRVPFERAPAVLADRAASLLAELGHGGEVRGRAWGFRQNNEYLGWDADPLRGPARWRRLAAGQPLAYSFWYRQSPEPLRPFSFEGGRGRVTPEDPPRIVEGMAGVVTDPRGRLVELVVVPSAIPLAAAAAAATEEPTPRAPGGAGGGAPSPNASAQRPPPPSVDWRRLFLAAGLDETRFTEAEPAWTPPVYADERRAWSGALADHPDIPIRVEAAGARGKAVYFRVVAPWDRPPTAVSETIGGGTLASGVVALSFVLTILVGAAALARRNLRLGRGDRRGAARLAAFSSTAAVVAALLALDLPFTLGGVAAGVLLLVKAGLFAGAVIWVCYMALEPAIRRRRPALLVSWSRLLSGALRDPLVGRDVLLGGVVGLLMAGAQTLGGWLKEWTGNPFPPNHYLVDATLNGTRRALAVVMDGGVLAVFWTLAIVVFLVIFRRVARVEAVAPVLVWAVFCAAEILFASRSWPAASAAAIVYALHVGTVARLGLLAGVVARFASFATASFPLTSDLSAPYADGALTSIATILGLSLYGLWSARTASRSPENDD